MSAVGMHRSQLDLAVESVLEARIKAERVCKDGQVTAEEWAALDAALEQCATEVESALVFDRIAESVKRTGRPNDYLVKTYSERVPWLAWFRPSRLRHEKRAA